MYMGYLMGKTEGQFANYTVYRFMKSIHINWMKFTTAVAARVANEVMAPATGQDSISCPSKLASKKTGLSSRHVLSSYAIAQTGENISANVSSKCVSVISVLQRNAVRYTMMP